MSSRTISATDAKLKFGTLAVFVKNGGQVIVEKNSEPQMAWISIDDYEDFLELKDVDFQKKIIKAKKEIEGGNFGTMNDLYAAHRKTIIKESR